MGGRMVRIMRWKTFPCASITTITLLWPRESLSPGRCRVAHESWITVNYVNLQNHWHFFKLMMQIGDDDFCENWHFVLNGNVNELMQRYPDLTTDIDHWLVVGLMPRTAYIFPTNCARSIRLTLSNKKALTPMCDMVQLQISVRVHGVLRITFHGCRAMSGIPEIQFRE